ncbi:MAG: hypothetical protein IT208_08590 [Chthonomonadales bacterium]|nr:hypothetical protein [Chthonomonadales bacterium]
MIRVCAVLLAALTALASGARAEPTLDLRGHVMEFPFWLGSTMYGSQWGGYAGVERRADWWWFDRDHWRRRFEALQAQRLNALAMLHPHPYPALVDLPAYPEARYLAPDELARCRDMFRWILAEGRRHGVRVYLLTWNIWVPPGFALAHALPESGADTPLVRAYTRAAVAALFRDFPDLAGLITMAAETPPGCVDFVVDAVCRGMRESGTSAELIFWSWCSYPEDSRRVRRAYPRARLMHYLQYEQFFSRRADPRIGRFSRACADAPMVALGGPKSAHGYLFWGDPEWVRAIVHDLRRQHGTGLFWETYCADPWLAQEAFARFAADADARYDPAAWARIVGAHYGRPDLGADLLAAMRLASGIVPRFIRLVHSQTDHYMPQMGLPLVYYLEMPTLSTYVFENSQTLDSRGYLRPNMGLCWPNPDWGEPVASVREWVAGRARGGAATPERIAAALERDGARCLALVDALRRRAAAADMPDLRSLLDRLQLNAWLGRHFAAKVRAAIAWERFRRGQPGGAACVARLRDSVAAWERVVAVADRLYPGDVTYWRSEIGSAPPWTQMQLWEGYAPAKGHWRENLAPFRREVEIVRAEVARGPELASLPLWEALRAAAPDRLTPIFRDDFERRDDGVWEAGECATWSRDARLALAGRGAVLLDSRKLAGEWHDGIRWRPGAVRLVPGHRYQVTFRYRVVAPSPRDTAPFAVAARSPEGGVAADIGAGRRWGGPRGALGRRTVLLAPERHDDYALFFSVRGRAAVVIDELTVSEIRPEETPAPRGP